ncbi:MAG: hypothetical protein QOC70_586 [Verrucomicrobiota bacterium]
MILVLVLPAMRQAQAGTEVSVDFFYDNVGSDGSWVEVADYGYCWQPNVAVSNSKWRPYSDGYWVYTDVGWTWVSYEDFGWATYHYGRWTRLRDRGWFWVPGREWGPAWVSWRTGGDYVGWAPLPPRGRGDVDDNRPINGQVDVEFDIGPAYYNFVDVRYIGEPVLRERIVETNLNVTYISQTVNVTNITYTNSAVYNYGPDYNTLSRYSTRPIRRMTLERESNVDLSVAVRSNALLRVQGDKLVVAAPPRLQKPVNPIAPKTVKEKIAKPTFERGWDGVGDPKAQAELKEKMKKEDPKSAPTPSFTPNANAAPAGSAMPATAATPAASVNPATTAAPTTSAASPALTPDRGKGKDKHLESASPMPTAASPVNPASSSATTPPGKQKKERDEKPVPAVTPPSSTVPGASPAPTRKKPSDRQQSTPSSLTTSPDGTPFREPPKSDKGVKKEKSTDKVPDTMPPTRQPSDPLTEKAPRKPKVESTPASQNREAPSDAPRKQPKADLSAEPAAPPKREVPPEASRKQPKSDLSAEPAAPPKREAPPEASRKQPKADLSAEPAPPPKREVPPEAPRKHPLPPEKAAPPPGPAANAPVKTDAPPSKQSPEKKKNEPAPSPGS